MSRAAWLISGGIAALAVSWAANYFETPLDQKEIHEEIRETLARSSDNWWSFKDISFFAGTILSWLPLLGLLSVLFGIISWLFSKSAAKHQQQHQN